ncbi:MAG: MFS transporter [Candidatus Lambdaproteobacteria bacterium]|nr:MFS transporter [Candidatus Lambdaproteobacteria bacterium]
MPPAAPGPFERALRLGVEVRPGEAGALAWAFAYFFCLMCSYYILRPVRDEMGVAGGVNKLQWLFTATFLAMLAAVPAFSALVARYPRRTFIPVVYRFFALNIVVFFLLLKAGVAPALVARAFFVWVSVFNLFVVSVFWSFMADLFDSASGKRLFGFIAAGGSAGALLGPLLTTLLVKPLGPVNLLLLSALLLEATVWCALQLGRWAQRNPREHQPAAPAAAHPGRERIGGGAFTGIWDALRSPYLLGISLYMLLYTATSTFLYFEQAHIVAAGSTDPAQRTQWFATIDLVVNVLSLAMQAMLTGRVIARFGVGLTLAIVPLLTIVGFVGLGVAPLLWFLIGFQGVRRASNFALARPAREILFTVVSREDKYKAKNFIDTVVYRGGDAVSGWLFAGLKAAGFGLAAIAFITVPVAAVWLVNGFLLGRRQERLAATAALSSPLVPTVSPTA